MAAEVGTRGREMILQGDCIEVMKTLEPNSIDAIVTDPPYNLHFMGKDWDKGLIHEKWLAEAFRVMKPGASLLAMGGTRTFHRMACAIEDTGFVIKDCLMWIYGQGFPKAQDLGKMIDKREGAERESLGLISKHRNRPKTDKWNKSNNLKEGCPFGESNGQLIDVTAAATPLAKHWDGFKIGGIKPAWESIIWAYKPLTDIELFSIMVHKIKELLCLIQKSNTTTVEKISKAKETTHGISQHGTGGQVASSVVMGMLLLELKKRYKDLNIVSSWKNTLEESLSAENTYITKMVSSTITDLKILNSLLFQNTELSVPQDSAENKKTNGEGLNASFAVDILIGVLAKLSSILTFSAQGLAILQAENQGSPLNKKLTPNFTPIIWAVKPPDGAWIDNVLKWGVGAVNVDACRVEHLGEKLGGGSQRRNTFAGKDGWDRPWRHDEKAVNEACIRCDEQVRIAESNGRFPANIILDEESAKVMDEQTVDIHSAGSKLNKGKWGNKSPNAIFPLQSGHRFGDSGGASRFFYCAKASTSERNAGLPDGERNTHPTVKPVSLMTWLIKLVTREGQVVLDPFMGSGTTGVSTKKTNRKFVGIEREQESIDTAKRRIAHHAPAPQQMELRA